MPLRPCAMVAILSDAGLDGCVIATHNMEPGQVGRRAVSALRYCFGAVMHGGCQSPRRFLNPHGVSRPRALMVSPRPVVVGGLFAIFSLGFP